MAWSGQRNAENERKREKRKNKGKLQRAGGSSRAQRKAAKDGKEIGARARIPPKSPREATGAYLVRRAVPTVRSVELEYRNRMGFTPEWQAVIAMNDGTVFLDHELVVLPDRKRIQSGRSKDPIRAQGLKMIADMRWAKACERVAAKARERLYGRIDRTCRHG